MENLQEKKFIKMTTEPVNKLILSLAAPTIASMLITAFYNMVDTFFVSKINTSATGAVGIVFSLMAIMQSFGFFFGQGSGNYMSRMLGTHNTKEAEKMAATGFFSSFFCGTVISILGLIFINSLAYFLGSTDTILPYATDYMRLILIGAPFFTSSCTLNNQLRFQGNAVYAMVGIVSGGILNIALDPLFIFVLDMGTSGAALATVISQFVSFLLLLFGTTQGSNIRIKFRNFRLKGFYFIEIIKGGTPSFCRQSIASVSTICLNFAAGAYGDSVIAAVSVISRVVLFLNSAVIGFGQGFQPVCGFNYGAKLYSRVKDAFKFCIKVSTCVLVGVAIPGIIFAPQIISVFTTGDETVLEVGTLGLRLQMLSFTLFGVIILSNMMMQNLGKFIPASLLSLARQGFLFIPLVFILPLFFGVTGIVSAQPLADLLTFLVTVPIQYKVIKNLGT